MSAVASPPNCQSLLTTQRLSAVFFVQLNEAYQITVLLPMVVFMVRDFGIEPELLGIYTSILNASFCFCQFLCCYIWGLLSDKYGRRIALISGLIFSTIAILCFGLSKTFTTAVIVRSVGGFFNGNLGVIKAYLSDITDGRNRAWAFTILAISYGFGSVLGSLCGGIFIQTHDVDAPNDEYKTTVGIIKWWIFEHEYPFLIPCLIGAIISGIALVLTLCFIHNEKLSHLDDPSPANERETRYQSIVSEEYMINTIDNQEYGRRRHTYAVNELGYMAIFGIHTIDHDIYSLRSVSLKSDALLAFSMTDLKDTKEIKKSPTNVYETIGSLVFETKLHHALVVWTLSIMAITMFHEQNPVYLAQALQFSSAWIGYAMGLGGFCLLLFTYSVQPYFLSHFKFRPMCIICCIAMCVVILHMPSVLTTVMGIGFANQNTAKTIAMILTCANAMASPCFTSISIVCAMCWVNNSVPNNYVGRANGLAQSFACLVRAIGPALTGFIWSASVSYIFTNHIAVYYAYLPSFVCYVVIALWIHLYIQDDAQLMWEEREALKPQSKILDDV